MTKNKRRKTKPQRQTTPPPPRKRDIARLCAGLTAAVALAGGLLRLLGLDVTLDGMQADEASIGYEAWSLLHFGIDRNGYSLPVHFVAWGGGQNALYAYLLLPFIAAFDLTIFSTRLLMALAGTASLLLFWRIAARAELKGANDTAHNQPVFALLAVTLLAFCPWHIMASRWALESNLLPFVILLAVYFFARADNHRLSVQSAGVFTLSLSVYAYASAYFFAPLFLALVFGWLRAQGKLPLRHLLVLGALSLATTLPIILLVAVNTLDWKALHIGGVSIPKYTGAARYEQMSTLFGGRLLAHLGEQWLFIGKLLTFSDPPVAIYPQNKTPGFALLFPLASAPIVFGFAVTIYRALKQREQRAGVHLLMALWLIAAWVTVSVTVVSIHRANVVWLPAVYFAALGVFYAGRRLRLLPPLAALAAAGYGGWFAHSYFTQYSAIWPYHNPGPAITAALERAAPDDIIYVTHHLHETYIQTLFYTQTPPQNYLATRDIPEPDVPFQKIASFGRFVFAPERIGEAKHLVLLQNRAGQLLIHPEESAHLDPATLANCARESHHHFAALSCN